jgi:thiamine-phosphate pyrophosphorylase
MRNTIPENPQLPVPGMKNKKIKDCFGFYAVLTDPIRGYEYCTQLLADYEIAFVQLRMKDAPKERIEEIGRVMRKITAGTKTRFIVNDCPKIAARVGADGVHVGQSDMPYREARTIVGDAAIVGISTHSVEQIKQACKLKPDYVGMGPVYATPTKKNPDPVVGLDGMKGMLAAATVPAVAIGGITLENLPSVLAAGALNFCMVRPLTQTRDPEKVLKEILKTYRSFVS